MKTAEIKDLDLSCKTDDDTVKRVAEDISVYTSQREDRAVKLADNNEDKYGNDGNIQVIAEKGKLVARYLYDNLNRLVREDNIYFGTIFFSYDALGNVSSKIVYKYTLDEKFGEATEVQEYVYAQFGEQYLLVSYCGKMCEYDVNGNPVVYRDRKLTRQEGKLIKNSSGIFFASFTYDLNGTRASKRAVTPFGTTYRNYVYNGDNLLAERRDGERINYIYGASGVAGFKHNNATYVYVKNAQGDVTHIYKKGDKASRSELAAQYVYDACGNFVIIYDIDGVARLNPFRYRSYYFD